ncbi:hypothetical protein E2320_010657, partial [Naja naja]
RRLLLLPPPQSFPTSRLKADYRQETGGKGRGCRGVRTGRFAYSTAEGARAGGGRLRTRVSAACAFSSLPPDPCPSFCGGGIALDSDDRCLTTDRSPQRATSTGLVAEVTVRPMLQICHIGLRERTSHFADTCNLSRFLQLRLSGFIGLPNCQMSQGSIQGKFKIQYSNKRRTQVSKNSPRELDLCGVPKGLRCWNLVPKDRNDIIGTFLNSCRRTALHSGDSLATY